MGGFVGLVNTGITKGMDKGSKKMGLVGVYILWLFASNVPEIQKATLGLLLIGAFILVQGVYDWVDIWRNPKGLKLAGLIGRLSKKMAAAGGYLGFIFQSNLSEDLKMKFGLAIVLLWLTVQGVYDGIKALRGEKKPVIAVAPTQ